MKVTILYKPSSEHAREVETFVHDLERQHDIGQLETIDADTREGVAVASLYDVVAFPGILALANDGQLLKSWQGNDLPLMEEVAYYTQAG